MAWLNKLRANHNLSPRESVDDWGLALAETYIEADVLDVAQPWEMSHHQFRWWHANGTYRVLNLPRSVDIALSR